MSQNFNLPNTNLDISRLTVPHINSIQKSLTDVAITPNQLIKISSAIDATNLASSNMLSAIQPMINPMIQINRQLDTITQTLYNPLNSVYETINRINESASSILNASSSISQAIKAVHDSQNIVMKQIQDMGSMDIRLSTQLNRIANIYGLTTTDRSDEQISNIINLLGPEKANKLLDQSSQFTSGSIDSQPFEEFDQTKEHDYNVSSRDYNRHNRSTDLYRSTKNTVNKIVQRYQSLPGYSKFIFSSIAGDAICRTVYKIFSDYGAVTGLILLIALTTSSWKNTTMSSFNDPHL